MQGDIAVARSTDKGATWQQLGIALDEDLHLSYPYIFNYNGQVNDVVLAGGNTLVSCSSDTIVKTWNSLSNGTCTRTLRQHSDYVTCLAAAERNGNIVASGGAWWCILKNYLCVVDAYSSKNENVGGKEGSPVK
ncbi:hypothetical protein POM88_050885 [Heracleum sosnowskyi]|uniref:Glucosamine inositolphosphorylceramide transferase 1 N-terminal domain-containing protein n=1 Tax=Heracleum sosnowskyi TaxID=360622 RepID=A0AAD8H0Q4_9APIA|nr:hypothetical protein POM88_050885 [Heracleum sosnowskyi]